MNWVVKQGSNQDKTNIRINFLNNTEQPFINSIDILCVKIDDGFKISVSVLYSGSDTLVSIKAGLASVGITDNMIKNDRSVKHIEFPTNDRKLIGLFFLGLSQAQADVTQLFDILTNKLRVEFTRDYAPPIWMSKIDSKSSIVLTNTKPQSKVCRIEMSEYSGQIIAEVFYPAVEVLDNIINSLSTVGINKNMIESEQFFKQIKFSTNDKKMMGLFFLGLSHAQEDVSQFFALLAEKYKIEFIKQYRPIGWISRADISGRGIIFTNTKAQTNICSIKIPKSFDGHVGVSVNFSEYDQLAHIKSKLLAVGVTDNMLNNEFSHQKEISFSTSDKKLLGLFFLALSNVQEDVMQLFDFLTEKYQVEFVEGYRPPVWISGPGLFRQEIKFINTNVQPVICNVTCELNGSGVVSVGAECAANDQLAHIKSILVAEGVTDNMLNNQLSHRNIIRFSTSDKKLLGLFFLALSNVQEDVIQLFDFLKEKHQIEFVQGYRPPVWISGPGLFREQIEFTNTNVKTTICKITCELKDSGEVSVSADCAANDQLAHIKSKLLAVGVTDNMLNNEFSHQEGLSFSTSDKKLIGLFFLALSHVQDDIKQIFDTLKEKHQIEFVEGYLPPVWISYLSSGIVFANTKAQIKINKVVLSEYSGFISIKAVYSTNDGLALIAEALRSLGITHNMFVSDVDTKTIRLNSYDKQLIVTFLRGLSQVQDDIEELITIICKKFNIELDVNYRPPMWIIQDHMVSSGYVTLTCTTQKPVIITARLSLSVDSSSCWAKLWYINQVDTDSLADQLGSLGMICSISENEGNRQRLDLDFTERLSFCLLLKFLANNEPEQLKHLIKTLSESFETSFMSVEELNFLLAIINHQWAEAKNYLDCGVNLENAVAGIFNLQILKAIFSYDLEQINKFFQNFEDSSIDQFKCPITRSLILDPVSIGDKVLDRPIGYERRSILQWIKINGTSPLTREEKTEENIQCYNALTQEIEQYIHATMQELKSAHSSRKRQQLLM